MIEIKRKTHILSPIFLDQSDGTFASPRQMPANQSAWWPVNHPEILDCVKVPIWAFEHLLMIFSYQIGLLLRLNGVHKVSRRNIKTLLHKQLSNISMELIDYLWRHQKGYDVIRRHVTAWRQIQKVYNGMILIFTINGQFDHFCPSLSTNKVCKDTGMVWFNEIVKLNRLIKTISLKMNGQWFSIVMG